MFSYSLLFKGIATSRMVNFSQLWYNVTNKNISNLLACLRWILYFLFSYLKPCQSPNLKAFFVAPMYILRVCSLWVYKYLADIV